MTQKAPGKAYRKGPGQGTFLEVADPDGPVCSTR